MHVDPLRPLVAGVGCRSGCPLTALQQLLADSGVNLTQLAALATWDGKRDEPALTALAQSLNIPLLFFPAERLNDFAVHFTAHSAQALAATGCASVAEGAALAAAAELFGQASLALPRVANRQATLACAW